MDCYVILPIVQLATDAVIGALLSPQQNGSAYVLLHHVMGEAAGKKGVWAYVEGGMGAVSESIAAAARQHGADIITDASVERILMGQTQRKPQSRGAVGAAGVRLSDGREIRAKHAVVSAISPQHTFEQLVDYSSLQQEGFAGTPLSQLTDLKHHIKHSGDSHPYGRFFIFFDFTLLHIPSLFPSVAKRYYYYHYNLCAHICWCTLVSS